MGWFSRKGQPPDRRDEPPEAPFGEDITNPDSRTMPVEFHGAWVRDVGDCGAERDATRKVISGDRIVADRDVHCVVAVRFIDVGKVAVVTLPAQTDGKEYSLFYFGLSEDGDMLIDLESSDWVLHRCPPKAG